MLPPNCENYREHDYNFAICKLECCKIISPGCVVWAAWGDPWWRAGQLTMVGTGAAMFVLYLARDHWHWHWLDLVTRMSNCRIQATSTCPLPNDLTVKDDSRYLCTSLVIVIIWTQRKSHPPFGHIWYSWIELPSSVPAVLTEAGMVADTQITALLQNKCWCQSPRHYADVLITGQ